MPRFRQRLTNEQHAAALAALRADAALHRAQQQDAELRQHEAAGRAWLEQTERDRVRAPEYAI